MVSAEGDQVKTPFFRIAETSVVQWWRSTGDYIAKRHAKIWSYFGLIETYICQCIALHHENRAPSITLSVNSHFRQKHPRDVPAILPYSMLNSTKCL
jgi:hypothetical protein